MKITTKSKIYLISTVLSFLLILSYLLAFLPTIVIAAPSSHWESFNHFAANRKLYLPIISNEFLNLNVNLQNKQSSADLFNFVYNASQGVEANWIGNHKSCDPGTTSDELKDAVRLRINYYRAMAGVPSNVAFLDVYNQKAQAAALMMSVNSMISHEPDPSWECYSEDGNEAAHKSNLFFGYYGPSAIDGYIKDPGGGNYAVGHRRWVLFPQTQFMGTGDIPYTGGYQPANALWIFDDNIFGPRPETRDGFVAWPPPGYVPYQVVFPKWSFSYPNADFSQATITIYAGGQIIPANPLTPIVVGYGENTIVWEPAVTFSRPPSGDTTHTVFINNVIINGQNQDFSYNVIVFDPGSQINLMAYDLSNTPLDNPPTTP